MINIIIVDNRWEMYTTKRHIFDMFDYLVVNKFFHKMEITEIIGKTEEEVDKLFTKIYGKLPDNLVIFLTKFISLSVLNIPKNIKINVIIENIHQKEDDRRDVIASLKKCTRIFAIMGHVFSRFYDPSEIGNVPIYWFPHSARFITPFNQNPVNKILVSGRLNKQIYPFRYFMYKMSKKYTFVEYLPVNVSYRIKVDDPSYIYGRRYVEYLNKYLACFTCEANKDRPYILAKNFEILGSGALLVAGNPISKKHFAELGFIDGVHYISVTMENVLEKIRYILDPNNREEIDQIRWNGYELVKLRHTYIHRGEFLGTMLSKQ